MFSDVALVVQIIDISVGPLLFMKRETLDSNPRRQASPVTFIALILFVSSSIYIPATDGVQITIVQNFISKLSFSPLPRVPKYPRTEGSNIKRAANPTTSVSGDNLGNIC